MLQYRKRTVTVQSITPFCRDCEALNSLRSSIWSIFALLWSRKAAEHLPDRAVLTLLALDRQLIL